MISVHLMCDIEPSACCCLYRHARTSIHSVIGLFCGALVVITHTEALLVSDLIRVSSCHREVISITAMQNSRTA